MRRFLGGVEKLGFNEINFLYFLISVLVVYYSPWLRGRQPEFLVISSLVFYWIGSGWQLLLLLFCVAFNFAFFWFSVKAKREDGSHLVLCGVAMNLMVLSFFKYVPMFPDWLFSSFGFSVLDIVLPVGISFYTFEGVSLLMDAKRQEFLLAPAVGRRKALIHISLFVSFFPHLVSGPILKAKQFFPQIGQKNFGDIHWDYCARVVIVGMFLKLFVADNLSGITDYMVLSHVRSSFLLVLLLLGYSAQIFCDFCGYSLVAVGLASLFGYSIPFNFMHPYLSLSLSEFWSRWHISLSSWLRDYLYIPLGGNRLGAVRTYVNLMVVMVLGGLWHGAAWKFAVWGGWHGLALVVERALGWNEVPKDISLAARFVRWLWVCGVVSLGWLAFKLEGWDQIWTYLVSMISNVGVETDRIVLVKLLFLMLPFVAYHFWHLWFRELNFRWKRGCEVLILSLLLSLTLIGFGPSYQFIYFQF